MKLPEINMGILESAYVNAVLVEAGEEAFGARGESLEDRARGVFNAWINDLEAKAEERGYAGGHYDGLADGYSNGHDEGSDTGYEIGHEAGYEAGFEAGFEAGGGE